MSWSQVSPLPGLRSVAVEDLIGSDQVQFPVALLEHVDPRQAARRGDQSLLHGGRVHQLPVQDGAAGRNKGRSLSRFRTKDGTRRRKVKAGSGDEPGQESDGSGDHRRRHAGPGQRATPLLQPGAPNAGTVRDDVGLDSAVPPRQLL